MRFFNYSFYYAPFCGSIIIVVFRYLCLLFRYRVIIFAINEETAFPFAGNHTADGCELF